MYLKPESQVSRSRPACIYINEPQQNWPLGAMVEMGRGRGGERDQRERWGWGWGERDKSLFSLASSCESYFLLVNSNNFFKGFFFPLFLFFSLLQNSVLHFLCSTRDPTLQVESKGRKAIPSVLVIKRICIMNHMPKGPVLHVGQIFV